MSDMTLAAAILRERRRKELIAQTRADMPAAKKRRERRRQAKKEARKVKLPSIMTRIRVQADPFAEGWVYYMRINGYIKIGYTKNLKQRSRNYPPGTELLAVEPGTRDLEKQRHGEFSRSLAQGREWFAQSDALSAHIAKVSEEYETPTAMMYSYSKHEGIKHV